jgi:hypothetical protein
VAIWYPSLLATRQSAIDGPTPRWRVLPANQRVVGLDFVKLNVSFVEHSGTVVR